MADRSTWSRRGARPSTDATWPPARGARAQGQQPAPPVDADAALDRFVTPTTPRIIYNALPLDSRGGGVSTYIRELLGAMVAVTDVPLTAAVRPSGRTELPEGVVPLVLRASAGVMRAFTGARGFGPCELVHGLDVDLP